MEQDGARDLGAGGNTIPQPVRVVQSKYWCFTWNNYPENWKEQMEHTFSLCSGWIVGKEVGEQGTPHLQGYLELKVKGRWSEFKLPKTLHWEKRKGTREQNVEYCAKENDCEGPLAPEILDVPKKEDLYSWQQELLAILEQKPDNRTINWYWEPEGGSGKTGFQRYVCFHHKDALFVNGSGDNVKCALASLKKETGRNPRIILWNIPRNKSYISYSVLEEIKDGLIFSGKYESAMLMMNSPHIVVFANREPVYEAFSQDKWNVVRITHPQNKPCDSE